MTDLHAHNLPGIDDGCANFPTALKLIKKEVEDGVDKIVVTPNFIDQLYHPSKNEIINIYQLLNKAVSELKWKVEIFLGTELRLVPDILEKYALSDFITINQTSYLLVDVY